MSRELYKYVDQLNASRPIFKLDYLASKSENIITFIGIPKSRPIYKYNPTPISNDPLSQLVCQNYYESFSTKTFTFSIDRDNIVDKTMASIRASLGYFVRFNLGTCRPIKNYRQSKLYKWVNWGLPNDSEFNDTVIMLYKYIRTFSSQDMKSQDKQHVENTIAILEAMMEKYGKQVQQDSN